MVDSGPIERGFWLLIRLTLAIMSDIDIKSGDESSDFIPSKKVKLVSMDVIINSPISRFIKNVLSRNCRINKVMIVTEISTCQKRTYVLSKSIIINLLFLS